MTNKNAAALFSIFLALFAASAARATPSTQIWSPSTDIQPYKVWHLGLDNYIRSTNKGSVTSNLYDAGLTVGVLPFEKIQLETGIDYLEIFAFDIYNNTKTGGKPTFTTQLDINFP